MGATLQFLNTTLAAVADAEGKISFDSVPVGTFNIEVRFLGYRTTRFEPTFPQSQDQLELIPLQVP